ncbi:MAG: 16S rRNA (uracil(1498)-N(3))-methyltransferase [Puniceicoccaceae bacterium]
MNRILFKQQQSSYTLDPRDSRFEHVRGVLRMGVGDSFDVGVVNGPAGKAEIVSLDKQEMKIQVVWGDRPDLPPPVSLIVGMCRPPAARRILLTVPTLGIRELFFPETGRSDPAYAKASLWKDGEWESRLIEGAEQAFDTYVPSLQAGISLEKMLAQLPDGGVRLALDVYEGTVPLTQVDLAPGDSSIIAIGPERGWNSADRELLKSAGFQLVSLNDRVLKVETAVTVGLTLLHAKLGVY